MKRPKSLKTKVLSYCIFEDCGQIRLFNIFLNFKYKTVEALFSERIGKRKFIKIGG